MRGVLAGLLLVCAALGATAAAETIVFQNGASPTAGYAGAADVHLENVVEIAWDPDANYRLLDLEADGEPVDKTTLLRWDVSAVPAAAVITSASITVQARGTSGAFELYEALRPWKDTEATGRLASAGVPWKSPCAAGVGSDRGATVLAQMDANASAPHTFALNDAGVALIADWVNGARANSGFVLQDFTADDGIDLAGMYHAAIDERPMLTVNFSSANGSAMVQLRNGMHPSTGYVGGTGTMLACGRGPGKESYGAAQVMSVEGGVDPKALLVKFDLTSLPRNARVSAAELKLVVRNGTQQQYGIYAQQRAWTEEASWEFADGVRPWGAPGGIGAGDHGDEELGRFGPTASSGAHQAALNDAGIQTVQHWITLALPNEGFFIHEHAGGAATTDDLHVYSSEAEPAANRPALVIAYDIPPGTIGLSPSQAFAEPGAMVQFKAAGGAAPFSWTLGVNNSGASIDDAGTYVAGPYGGTFDKVTLTDSAGLQASAAVSVRAGGLPRPKADAGVDAGEADPGAREPLPQLKIANFGCSATGGPSIVALAVLLAARSRWRRRGDSE